MDTRGCALLLAIFLTLPARGAEPARESLRVDNFALLDHRGRFHELAYYADRAAIVLFIQGNGCPISRNSVPALAEVRADYEGRGVVFLMLNANLQDDRESIAAEAREFGIDFPILVDEAQLVAGSLVLERTAEVLVIDPERFEVAYRGPVDDRLDYRGGRSAASRHYLREALDALLAGAPVELDAPPASGCLIALRRGRASSPPISYADDVAPLLERRCLDCHRKGGVAPWAMSSYETVRGWAPMMREVVRTLRMPPGQRDPHIGSFFDQRALRLEEQRTLVHWIEAGAPRGEGSDPLPPASSAPAPEWPLGAPDLVLDVAPQSLPATGLIDYRYAALQASLERDVWVRATDLRPSNLAAMHHALAFASPPGGSSRRDRFWKGVVSGYAPGRPPQRLPPDTGRFIPAGTRFRFQLHYTATGRPETDAPRLALYFHDEPPRYELKTAAAINFSFQIPPHAAHHEVRATHTFHRDVVLYRMTPHMHYRGRSMSFEAHYPDGATELLLSVPDYQFDWQRVHVLREPKLLPAGTRVVCRGVFDNSARNRANPDPAKWIRWGEQSFDEMFIGYLLYREAEPGELRSAAAGAQSVSVRSGERP